MQAMIASLLDRFLLGDAAPAALRALYMIVNDSAVAPGVRVSAANSLLDRAGFDSKRHAVAVAKDGSEMTRDELRAKQIELEGQIATLDASMRVVSEPLGEPITSQELDMYE